jgi:hypothetical protein
MRYGERLEALLARASQSVFIAAPFIKRDPFSRLLQSIPTSVRDLVCVTRWSPEEVASGVSDLEVFDLVRDRPGASLWLHPLLHAKAYRADNAWLVGSANLTRRALGWASPSNVELLINASQDPEVSALEAMLRAQSIPATESIRDAIKADADALPDSSRGRDSALGSDETQPMWLPTCPNPSGLWNIYAGHEVWRLVPSAEEGGRKDLQFLNLPAGLSRPLFVKFVGAILTTLPVVQEINSLMGSGLSDERAVEFIASLAGSHRYAFAPREMWEILKAWLEHFLAGTYRRRASTELFTRGREFRDF